MKQFLLKTFLIFQQKKKLIVTIVILFVFFISLIILATNKTDNKKGGVTPSPRSSSIENTSSNNYKRQEGSPVYILNRFNSLTNMIGYTWLGDKIVYATKNGIFRLWQNEQIFNGQIDYINFNSTGKGVYLSNGDYYLFDSFDNSSTKIGPDINSPQLNGNGDYIIYQKINSVFLQSLKGGDTKVLDKTDNQNTSIGWAGNSNLFYVYKRNLNSIEVYDVNLRVINSININGNSLLSDLNENGDKFVTISKNILSIINIKGEILKSFEFSQDSKLNSYWINTDEVFVIETAKRGTLDLFDNYMWIVDINGDKKFLANSQPITNKLNLKTKVFINKSKNAVVLNENLGKLWILSLIPSRVPIYLEEGVSFYNMGPNSRED